MTYTTENYIINHVKSNEKISIDVKVDKYNNVNLIGFEKYSNKSFSEINDFDEKVIKVELIYNKERFDITPSIFTNFGTKILNTKDYNVNIKRNTKLKIEVETKSLLKNKASELIIVTLK